ncbi:MAG: sulfite exporter TauE/SafE family protein [Planctomycetes bacterium]|nr:sulfite exporter TauE/SafE family protein [Planctomycetota bacterium]
MLTPLQLAALPLIGFGAGVMGGLLGIGGGLVIIPALLLFLGQTCGPGSLHVYKIAALATAVVLSIPAARQHIRARAVVPRMLPAMEAFGIIGVAIGVATASLLSGVLTRWLQVIFGVAMIAFVVSNVWLRRRKRAEALCAGAACPTPGRWAAIGLRVGAPAGIVSGLLGIGGGAWAVPAQNLMLRIRLQTAIGNSTCMIVGVALSAAVFKSISVARMPDLNWLDGLLLALWLSPGALIGGWIGAMLTHRLPVERLRNIFLALLAITGIRLLFP